jgi:regulator of protease activity HflC (stomatin/prohibitin superfamily)
MNKRAWRKRARNWRKRAELRGNIALKLEDQLNEAREREAAALNKSEELRHEVLRGATERARVAELEPLADLGRLAADPPKGSWIQLLADDYPTDETLAFAASWEKALEAARKEVT